MGEVSLEIFLPQRPLNFLLHNFKSQTEASSLSWHTRLCRGFWFFLIDGFGIVFMDFNDIIITATPKY